MRARRSGLLLLLLFSLFSVFVCIPVPVVHAILENFESEDWVEYDPEGDYIQIYNATHVNWFWDRRVTAYLYKDMGVDGLTNFTHKCDGLMHTASAFSVGFNYVCGNTLINSQTMYLNYPPLIWLRFYAGSPYRIQLYVKDAEGNLGSDYMDGWVLQTWYYFTIVKEGNTVTVYIYSDSSRETLVDTLQASTTNDFSLRYVFAGNNPDTGSSQTGTGDFDNMDLGISVFTFDFAAPGTVYPEKYFMLNMTLNHEISIDKLVNASIGLNGSIILLYVNSTDVFSVYSDPNSYCTINSSGSSRLDINSTDIKLSWCIKLGWGYPEGNISVLYDDTMAYDDDGKYGNDYKNNLFIFDSTCYLTICFTTGGQFRIDNVTMTNSSVKTWPYDSVLEFAAIPINASYVFQNFTWASNASTLNPYNFTTTQNVTAWCNFREPTDYGLWAFIVLAVIIILFVFVLLLAYTKG